MDDYLNVMSVLVLAIPLFVTGMTEILKRLPVLPQVNKYTKITALVVSAILVGFLQYQYAELTPDFALLVAGEIVATYAAAVGFYETLKKLIAKL